VVAKDKRLMKFRDAWVPKSREQAGYAEYSRIELPMLARRLMTREERVNPELLTSDTRISLYCYH